MSASTHCYSASLSICELHASLGVDVQALRSAPFRECFRIDYGAHNAHSPALGLALDALRHFLPLSVSPRENLRVCHDAENFRIVGLLVPADANDLDLHACLPVSSEMSILAEYRGGVIPPSSLETAAPDAREAPGAGRAVTVHLSPAVMVILRLLEVSTDLSIDEIVARGIGVYANKLALPVLSRDMEFDLVDVPQFRRSASRPFKGGAP